MTEKEIEEIIQKTDKYYGNSELVAQAIHALHKGEIKTNINKLI